jgi:trk system potassium uptake protein TrkA
VFVVVIGLGEVGRHLLRSLGDDHHDVVAIDSDPEALAYCEEHHDVMTMLGFGANPKVLEQARVGKADLVITVTDHDELNLVAALASKQAGAGRVIARVQGNDWIGDGAGMRYGFLGVDVVINPRVLVAQELTKIARSHGATEVVELANDRVELVQVELSEDSPALQKPLSRLPLPKEALVAAVVREGKLFVPGGADVLRPKDRLYLIGLRTHITLAEDVFSRRREARRVCIVGGGVVGQSLAEKLLKDEAEVLLIEEDLERAEALSETLEGASVIHGDGTNLELLMEEEVGRFDLFASVTQDDEVNLMAGLLAQRAGASRTAVLVQRADYTEIYRQLGIDVVLSPRTVASNQILKYVRASAVERLAVLEGGEAEVLELRAEEGSRVVGEPIHRLNLPRGTLIAAVIRGSDVTVPRGEHVLEHGDTVICLVTGPSRSTVERLFHKRAL